MLGGVAGTDSNCRFLGDRSHIEVAYQGSLKAIVRRIQSKDDIIEYVTWKRAFSIVEGPNDEIEILMTEILRHESPHSIMYTAAKLIFPNGFSVIGRGYLRRNEPTGFEVYDLPGSSKIHIRHGHGKTLSSEARTIQIAVFRKIGVLLEFADK